MNLRIKPIPQKKRAGIELDTASKMLGMSSIKINFRNYFYELTKYLNRVTYLLGEKQEHSTPQM